MINIQKKPPPMGDVQDVPKVTVTHNCFQQRSSWRCRNLCFSEAWNRGRCWK